MTGTVTNVYFDGGQFPYRVQFDSDPGDYMCFNYNELEVLT